jgi:hypothetical protein
MRSASNQPAELSWPSPQFLECNRLRFDPGSTQGHYESYFQRANHPQRPLAFWIRYTIFSPLRQPERAVGQLWAVYFDGEARWISAVKEEFPVEQCSFSGEGFAMDVGGAHLDSQSLAGSTANERHSIQWNLSYRGYQPPLLLLPSKNYRGKFPAAKALVGLPFACYDGSLQVEGEPVPVEGWIGSQNHNWGSRHTDQYAWGQVAGFEDTPDAFLECVTARLKIGPFWTPWLTNLVLRIGEREYALNSIPQALRARGRCEYFTWSFASRNSQVAIQGVIQAERDQFVGLKYENPPGGFKTCLNTKIARCQITLQEAGKSPQVLSTESRAAFEIVTDDDSHGVEIVI